jgi:hypothetical protein
MYTRFWTPTKVFLFVPKDRLRYKPHGQGARFLGMLGGAYEFEAEESLEEVIQEASLLADALRNPMCESYVEAPRFLDQLERLLQFLSDCDVPTIHLYSYENRPTLDDIISAEASGGGAADWAMEEACKRGSTFIPELAAMLNDIGRTQNHLSVVRLLLFCFPGDQSQAIVKRYIEAEEDSLEKQCAAMLLASVSNK